MANFTTHLAVGTVLSGGLATLTLAANVISPESLVAVTLAGVVGGVLPDIDLKDSRPSRVLFSGLAIAFSFVVLFTFAQHLSVVEMLVAWLGTLALVRYGGEAFFHRLSYHRGIFHSILCGVTFWFITAIVYKHVLGYHEGVAWLAGGFLFLGFLSHLILDEVYSIDVDDRRLKTSFGTALKLLDFNHLGQSGAMAAVCAVAFALTPPAAPFVSGISSKQLWTGLEQKLLPRGTMFGVDTSRLAMPGRQRAETQPIATGSLPAAPGVSEDNSAPKAP